MNKYIKLLARLKTALNEAEHRDLSRWGCLIILIDKVEKKIDKLANSIDQSDDGETRPAGYNATEPTEKEMEEGAREYKENAHSQFMHDIEQGRYDRLTPVKWDEVETYQDPNAGTSLDEELEQFSFDNNNQG